MPTYGEAICTTSEIGKIRNKGGMVGQGGGERKKERDGERRREIEGMGE